MNRFLILCLSLLMGLGLVCGPAAQAQALQAPEIAARAYVLLDVTAGQVLASREADTAVEPASLTKLMTAYLVFQALEQHQLTLQQELVVSERAWRTGMTESSRMFIQVGTRVAVEDLIRGMIIQSGNDATVLLAEAVGGSVEAFVERMNRQALAFGLKNTQFKNPEGLPAAGHVSTARELAIIAARLLTDFPERVGYYRQKEFTYNKITQGNRNLLLWRDPSVDGLKTGYTDAAGYCLIASAKRDLPNGARRLISVVLGAASKEARANESQKLLNWGYANFDMIKLFDARQTISTAPVWKGAKSTALLGSLTPVYALVPRGTGQQIKTELTRTDPLIAPLEVGQRIGVLKISAPGQPTAEVPLTVIEAVPVAGVVGRLWDSLRLFLK
jgi:D-alanyl-D-alanine carboxypeptidase (penicillin-binding protein 5/6)